MNDLDTLRPEVREAIREIAVTAVVSRPDLQHPIGTIRAELLRLDAETNRLHKVACEQLRRAQKAEAERDDLRTAYTSASQSRDYWRECAERIEAELAALRARIAEAPLEVVESLPGAVGPPWPGDHWIEVRMAAPCACDGDGLIGQRVRLVVEE